MERVRSGLPLVAARQDDQAGVIGAQRLGSQAKPRDGAGRKALDEHVGLADERARESDARRMLQVERRAAFAVVVEREHRRAVRLDDAVLERRVRRAEDVGGETALETDHLGAEVREVLADQRAGCREPQLHDADAVERAKVCDRGRPRRNIGHTTPAARSRSSSPEETPHSR